MDWGRGQRGWGGLLPEEQQHRLGEGLEVVVAVDLGPVHQGDLPEHLQVTKGWTVDLDRSPTVPSSPNTLHLRSHKPGYS